MWVIYTITKSQNSIAVMLNLQTAVQKVMRKTKLTVSRHKLVIREQVEIMFDEILFQTRLIMAHNKDTSALVTDRMLKKLMRKELNTQLDEILGWLLLFFSPWWSGKLLYDEKRSRSDVEWAYNTRQGFFGATVNFSASGSKADFAQMRKSYFHYIHC